MKNEIVMCVCERYERVKYDSYLYAHDLKVQNGMVMYVQKVLRSEMG